MQNKIALKITWQLWKKALFKKTEKIGKLFTHIIQGFLVLLLTLSLLAWAVPSGYLVVRWAVRGNLCFQSHLYQEVLILQLLAFMGYLFWSYQSKGISMFKDPFKLFSTELNSQTSLVWGVSYQILSLFVFAFVLAFFFFLCLLKLPLWVKNAWALHCEKVFKEHPKEVVELEKQSLTHTLRPATKTIAKKRL